MLHRSASAPKYDLPAISSGAAYAGDPQQVSSWCSMPPCNIVYSFSQMSNYNLSNSMPSIPPYLRFCAQPEVDHFQIRIFVQQQIFLNKAAQKCMSIIQ